MVFFLLFPFLISSLHQVPPLASIKRPTASPFVSGCASSSRAEDGANEHRGHGENTEIFQIKAPLPFKWFQHQRLSGPRPSPHKNTVNSTGKKTCPGISRSPWQKCQESTHQSLSADDFFSFQKITAIGWTALTRFMKRGTFFFPVMSNFVSPLKRNE